MDRTRTCCSSSPAPAAALVAGRGDASVALSRRSRRRKVGVLVPFLAMTRYDFSFLSAGAARALIVHPGLNVIRYKSARLIVRIHEIDMVATQTLEVAAFGTDPSSRDPREFALSSSTLSVIVTSADVAGSLATRSDSDLLPYLKVVVTGQQGPLTGSLPLFAVLSADLVVYE